MRTKMENYEKEIIEEIENLIYHLQNNSQDILEDIELKIKRLQALNKEHKREQ